MSIGRRTVLKGMGLAGLAGLSLSHMSLAGAAQRTSASQHKPLVVLVSSTDPQEGFVAGMQAHPAAGQATVLHSDHSLQFIRAFEQRLSSGKQQRIIGLVDDASGMLLLDLARSAGARVHWTGQHVTENGVSRHNLSTTPAAHGCVTQFAALTEQCSRPVALTEQYLSASRQWTAALGFALTSPEPNRRYMRATPPADFKALDGHYISFSIET